MAIVTLRGAGRRSPTTLQQHVTKSLIASTWPQVIVYLDRLGPPLFRLLSVSAGSPLCLVSERTDPFTEVPLILAT